MQIDREQFRKYVCAGCQMGRGAGNTHGDISS